jgi:diguanylate cyclase (GGDEF)-like protein/PAS domain S-box-containing protein
MIAPVASEGLIRGTIVIAEDDVATRMLLSQVLKRQHFHVIAVENGQLACEAVRRERPNVILLDWRMPVMDGRAAVQELRSNKETRGIPIVMLTVQSDVKDRIIALESGVQDFLSKPFDPRELVACIEQQLRWQEGLAVDAHAALVEERNSLLAASERRYRLLAEAMPQMVWMADAQGRITYVNRAWSAYVGQTLTKIGGISFAQALHPDDRIPTLRAWAHSLETGEPFETQCRFARASDGMYRWHLARAVRTSDASGTIREWVGSCADIHDYKIASETRTILDTMGSVVAIRTDAGFVDYTSPYWSQYVGSHAGSGLGFGWRDFIHPDDLAVVDRSRADDGAAPATTQHYEMRLRGHDGEYRWFLSRSKMLPQSAGTSRRWLDTLTDVDDLKRAQSALKTSETRYRALTDSIPQMVWVIDADGGFEYVNHRWSNYTGLSLEQTRSANRQDFIHVEDLAAVVGLRTASEAADYTCEARFRRCDGVYRWHKVRAVPFHDITDKSDKWIATATDIEDSKVAAAQLASTAAELQQLALHDPVTALPNRMLLVERLAAAIALAQRAKTGVIVLYLDLDRFKAVNDTLGHAAGDHVLAVTAKRVADALRVGDTASRVGGDEFVLVCATSEGAAEAARVAKRLHSAVNLPIDIQGESVTVGASIGISLYPTDGLTGDELIEKADSAMYAAKESGRNGFRLYSDRASTSSTAALDFETELRAAIASNQIVVHYQPIISLQTKRLICAEALVRWQHPQRGLLTADQFLPFAEQHHFIGAIGRIVLDAVCSRIVTLQPLISGSFSIAMNVSARQFADPGFVDAIAAALIDHHIQAQHLAIELTEEALMTEPAAIASRLAQLQALGVRISMGNFGVGYTSLASIKGFPLDFLKIDRSFVQNIVRDPADQAVAKTIITLGHSLGMRIVAEGVETDDQADALRSFGSDAIQGFVASRPMAAAEFDHYMQNDSPVGLAGP